MSSIMDCERQFHIRTLPDEVGKYVILPGDPDRVPKIAEYLENAVQVAHNREFNIFTGTLDGQKVTVCSTGIGGASAAIAVEELIKCGADTFIRIGTSGGIDLSVYGGDLIVSTAAVRGEGTSFEYIPSDYPAVADYEVVSALVDSAKKLSANENGNRYHVGVVHCKDSFYGEVEPENSAVGDNLNSRWSSYIKCGCLTSEMESSAIFAVGIARHVRCGSVLTALWNVERSKAKMDDNITDDSTRGIKCAVNAIKLLIERDKIK